MNETIPRNPLLDEEGLTDEQNAEARLKYLLDGSADRLPPYPTIGERLGHKLDRHLGRVSMKNYLKENLEGLQVQAVKDAHADGVETTFGMEKSVLKDISDLPESRSSNN